MTASRDARRKADVPGAAPRVYGRNGDTRVPEATVARLAAYLRVLGTLADRGVATVSSEEHAVAAGVNSAKLRKDLSYLGSYGIRVIGYDVTTLTEEMSRVLSELRHFV